VHTENQPHISWKCQKLARHLINDYSTNLSLFYLAICYESSGQSVSRGAAVGLTPPYGCSFSCKNRICQVGYSFRFLPCNAT